MPLSGKSTVGEMLSEKLDFTFIDTDRLIEEIYFRQCGSFLPVREIYKTEGEEAFRELENEAVLMASKCQNTIISLGGGAIISEENRTLLKKTGTMIYLKASIDTLKQRLKENLPAVFQKEDSESSLRDLLKKREKFYEESSDIEFQVDGLSQDEIVSALARLIERNS